MTGEVPPGGPEGEKERGVMSIPRRRVLGLIVLTLSPLPFVALLPAGAWTAPVPATRPVVVRDSTRTYRFTARIEANGGIAPFKVGDTITGTFTYDLKGKNTRPDNL